MECVKWTDVKKLTGLMWR